MKEDEIRKELEECGLNEAQIEEYLKLFTSLSSKNEKDIRAIIKIYPHPTTNQVELYKENRTNKIDIDYDFSRVDDRTVGELIRDIHKIVGAVVQTSQGPTLRITPELLQKLSDLRKLLKDIEQKSGIHIHKGTLLHDNGIYLLENMAADPLECGLLLINRAFLEDDMKHIGPDLFPLGKAYSQLNLSLQTTFTKKISKQLQTLLGSDAEFQQLRDKFLDLPSTERDPKKAFRWLEHVIFFNYIMMKLMRIWNEPDVYHSYLGQILQASIIGHLSLFIESVCKCKLGLIYSTYGSVHRKLINTYYSHWHQLSNGDINRIKTDFDKLNIENTIESILEKRYWISDEIQCSFVLAWWLRNSVMHAVFSHWVINKKFEEIIKKIFEFLKDFIIHYF